MFGNSGNIIFRRYYKKKKNLNEHHIKSAVFSCIAQVCKCQPCFSIIRNYLENTADVGKPEPSSPILSYQGWRKGSRYSGTCPRPNASS